VPTIEVTVNPDGGASLTVTSPDVDPAPAAFETVIVYDAPC
jgi:hypothetical protein